MKKEKLLLHSCCGPCSTAVIEKIAEEFDITIFFYNPNIDDEEEYEKRKENQIKYINIYNEGKSEEEKVKFLEGDYRIEDFIAASEGLEHEKEGGARCRECFKLRLGETAKQAVSDGYRHFGTTLTVSPHKNYSLISEIGHALEEAADFNIQFLDRDFKKQDGYRRSVELSKEYELYRQRYCGCSFSKWF